MSVKTREPADGIVKVPPLHFIRDYETVKVEQEVPNELLLLFNDEARPPTANYKNVERKVVFKKGPVSVSQGSLSPLVVVLTNGFPFPAPGNIRQMGHHRCQARWNERDGGGTG